MCQRPQPATMCLFPLVALLCCGCPAPSPDTEPRRDENILVVGTAVDAAGVNQIVSAHTRFSQDIIDLLFLRLFEEQPGFASAPPSFEPEIVEAFSWSSDGKNLVLELRDDIVWSDGTPLTAEDVLWTWQVQTDPELGWSYAHSKEAIEQVEILGPHEIVFRFSRANASRLAEVNEGVIMPKHVWSRLPLSEWRSNAAWFLDNLAVSGPYTVGAWEPQQQIVLERNPLYFQPGLPRIPQVVFRVIPEHSHRIRQLLSGDLDFVERLRPQEMSLIETSPVARPHTYWHRQYSFIVWNGCRPPFSDPRVRRALTMAIDRHSLTEALLGTSARIGISPIPQSVWAFNVALEPWPFDPEAASLLLADAGWTDGDGDGWLDRDGLTLRFDLSTNGDNSLRVDAGLIIQHQLAKIGVDARLQSLEFNRLVEENMAHDFDATIGAWGIDTTLDLGYAFHSESSADGYNYGCYSNPRVDRLIESIREVPRLEDARVQLDELQILIHRDQPYTFLWEPLRIDGASYRLEGVTANPLSAFFDLEEWRLIPRQPQLAGR